MSGSSIDLSLPITLHRSNEYLNLDGADFTDIFSHQRRSGAVASSMRKSPKCYSSIINTPQVLIPNIQQTSPIAPSDLSFNSPTPLVEAKSISIGNSISSFFLIPRIVRKNTNYCLVIFGTIIALILTFVDSSGLFPLLPAPLSSRAIQGLVLVTMSVINIAIYIAFAHLRKHRSSHTAPLIGDNPIDEPAADLQDEESLPPNELSRDWLKGSRIHCDQALVNNWKTDGVALRCACYGCEKSVADPRRHACGRVHLGGELL